MLRRLLSARSSGLGLRWRPGSIRGLGPLLHQRCCFWRQRRQRQRQCAPARAPARAHPLERAQSKAAPDQEAGDRGGAGAWVFWGMVGGRALCRSGWGVAKASLSAVDPRPSPPTARRTRCTTRARASNTGSGTASTSGASCRRATWTSRRRYRGCVSRMYAFQCMLRTWQGQTRGVVDDGSHTHELARMKTFFKFLGSAD